MPYKKKSPIERKIISSLGGINNSTKAQLKKISKIKIDNVKPKVPTTTLYIYINGKWVCKGLCCRYCNSILNNDELIDKHQYICKVLNKKTEDI